MAANKVIYNGNTLIDLTSDTLTSSDQLLNGVVAHSSNGETITGNVVIQKYYTGSQQPDSSFGQNGDLYLVV